MDVLFWLIMGAGYLFSLGVQQTLKRTYNKWSQVPNRWQAGGAEVARRILDDNDLSKVPVELTKGQLSDHYDPRSPTIQLSRPIYESPSVAAMAVAAHEAGHALQDADDYAPLESAPTSRRSPTSLPGSGSRSPSWGCCLALHGWCRSGCLPTWALCSFTF